MKRVLDSIDTPQTKRVKHSEETSYPVFDIPDGPLPVGKSGHVSSDDENSLNKDDNVSDEEYGSVSHPSKKLRKNIVDFENIKYAKALKEQYGIAFDDDNNQDVFVNKRDLLLQGRSKVIDQDDMFGEEEQPNDEENDDDDLSDSEYASKMAQKALKYVESTAQTADDNKLLKYASKQSLGADDELEAYRKRARERFNQEDIEERITSTKTPSYNEKLQTFIDRDDLTKEQRKDDAWAADLEDAYEKDNLKAVALDSDDEAEADDSTARTKPIDTLASKMNHIAKKDAEFYQYLSSTQNTSNNIGIDNLRNILTILADYTLPEETLQQALARLRPAPTTSTFAPAAILKKKNVRKADREAALKALEAAEQQQTNSEEIVLKKKTFDTYSEALDGLLVTGMYDALDKKGKEIQQMLDQL